MIINVGVYLGLFDDSRGINVEFDPEGGCLWREQESIFRRASIETTRSALQEMGVQGSGYTF